jgi:hypothetical protein
MKRKYIKTRAVTFSHVQLEPIYEKLQIFAFTDFLHF